MKKDNKKFLAQTLYVENGLTQAEVAQRLETTQQQVSRWARNGNWLTLRATRDFSYMSIIRKTQDQINKLYAFIEQEDRTMTAQESDQISKLMKVVKDLDRSYDLQSYVQAFEEFLTFIREIDEELCSRLAVLQYDFLADKIKKISTR